MSPFHSQKFVEFFLSMSHSKSVLYTETFISIFECVLVLPIQSQLNTCVFVFFCHIEMTDSADIYYSIAFKKVNIDLFILLCQQFAMV